MVFVRSLGWFADSTVSVYAINVAAKACSVLAANAFNEFVEFKSVSTPLALYIRGLSLLSINQLIKQGSRLNEYDDLSKTDDPKRYCR